MLDRADFYDAELKRHTKHLIAAASVGVSDHVLDVGCGAGQTTRDAASLAVNGKAIGVDTSSDMLEVARQRANDSGLRNIAFEKGDAQTHLFPQARFDLCISRFGAMFFSDPAAAFANIASAMRPDARLAWMVWQNQDKNEWSGAIRRTVAPTTMASPETRKAFSLGEPAIAKELLNTAGYVSVDFIDVREPVFYGASVDSAFDALMEIFSIKDMLAQTNEAPEPALQRLRNLLEAHMTTDGVLFDSRAWIITARRE